MTGPTLARQSNPNRQWQRIRDSAGARRGLVVLFGVSMAAGFFGISSPTASTDETATVFAVQRSWPGLIDLWSAQDAPLAPYYALAKVLTDALSGLPTVTALRSVSAVSAAITVTAVYWLVARRIGVVGGLLAGGLLIGLPGFARYSQEARPYAVLTMMTALAWLAWDQWRRPSGLSSGPSGWLGLPRGTACGGLRYAGALAGSALFHVFGLFHWPAQILADLTTQADRPRARLHRVVSTLVAMALSLALIGIPLALAVLRGTGTNRPTDNSFRALGTAVVFALTDTGRFWVALPTLALAGAAIAFLAWRSPVVARYRDLTRVLTIWLFVPLGLSWVAALIRSPLLKARYLVPIQVPFAALAAVGALATATLVGKHVSAWLPGGPRRSVRAAVIAQAAVLALVCAVQSAVALPEQARVRRPSGHSVRLAPLSDRLDRILRDEPTLPLAVSPASWAGVIKVARPDWSRREVLYFVEPHGGRVWPKQRPAADVHKALAETRKILWLWRGDKAREPTVPPQLLAGEGFQVESAERLGSLWLCVLRR